MEFSGGEFLDESFYGISVNFFELRLGFLARSTSQSGIFCSDHAAEIVTPATKWNKHCQSDSHARRRKYTESRFNRPYSTPRHHSRRLKTCLGAATPNHFFRFSSKASVPSAAESSAASGARAPPWTCGNTEPPTEKPENARKLRRAAHARQQPAPTLLVLVLFPAGLNMFA